MTIFNRIDDSRLAHFPTDRQYRFEYHHRYSNDSLVFLTAAEPNVKSAIERLMKSQIDKDIYIDKITEIGTLSR